MKPSRKIWWIAGVAPALAMGAWWLTKPDTQKHRVSKEIDRSTEARDYAELRGQVQALSRQTRQLQASAKQAPASAASPARSAEDAREHENADPLAQMEPREREKLLLSSTLALMESTFGGETSDPDYSSEASAAIDERLSQEAYTGTRSLEVNCGSSLCRFRFGHETADAREPFQDLIGTGPMSGNTFFNFDPETLETVVYMAREGHDLPKADLQAAAARL